MIDWKLTDVNESNGYISSDPFKDSEFGEEEKRGAGKRTSKDEYIHIRIQQRNGRKCVTTVQGLHKDFNYNRILKDVKKEFCCNGNVVQDEELGKVIQLQGDQRKNVSNFLIQVSFHASNFLLSLHVGCSWIVEIWRLHLCIEYWSIYIDMCFEYLILIRKLFFMTTGRLGKEGWYKDSWFLESPCQEGTDPSVFYL